MNKVRDNMAGAIGGWWIWKHPETGFVVKHSNYAGCKMQVRQFLRANNYPIGSNFDQEFEDNICANGDPRLCFDWTPPTLLQKMTGLASALAKWANSGFKVRTAEEVTEILETKCKPCQYYAGQTGTMRIACAKCGCSKLKLYLLSSHCPLAEPKW